MQRKFLVNWLKCALFIVLVSYTASLLTSLIAIAANMGSFSLSIGPIPLVDYTAREGSIIFSTKFVLGEELLTFACLGGLVYALGALYLAMRRGGVDAKQG